jgi:sugar phosphate isomerase/epimerase
VGLRLSPSPDRSAEWTIVTIGLSTYSFFWQWHETAPRPISLVEMIDKTADWDVHVLQICDYPAIDGFDSDAVRQLGAAAERAEVTLELGTRGLDHAHLTRYLSLAQQLGARLVRSMIRAEEVAEAVELLRQVIPTFERAGVSLALETYEQIPTARLMEVVRRIKSANLGVCLDPANCVPAMETPRSTIDLVADHVFNLHVKDFAFTRQVDWVGFTYAGTRLGEGLLDFAYLMERVRPDERGINKIIEHWLVWQGDSAKTCAVEDEWTLHNLDFLRRHEISTTTAPLVR